MTLPVSNILSGIEATKAAVTKVGAIIQVTTWCSVYLAFICINEEHKAAGYRL